MEPTRKKKWVEALRSGGYKQGRVSLCSVDANGDTFYCCLGVLYELDFGKMGWRLSSIFDRTTQKKVTLMHANYAGSTCFYEAEGIPSDEIGNLMGMNDTEKSFAEIADYIEKCPDI